MYAALAEKFGHGDGRARLDAELALPLGMTIEQLEAEQKEWMASNGF